jgi:hypothetical protein
VIESFYIINKRRILSLFPQDTRKALKDLAYMFLEGFFIREMKAVYGHDWIKVVKVRRRFLWISAGLLFVHVFILLKFSR